MTGEPVVPMVPHEYQQAAMRWISRTVHALERELHPVLKEFRTETIAELPVDEDADDGLGEPPDFASPLFRPMRSEHSLTVTVDEVLDFEIDAFLASLHGMADDMGGQMVRGFIEHLSEISEETGNVINADGDFWEGMLKALETVEFSFNEDGTHNLSYIVSPEVMKDLESRPPTPEQEKRMEEILTRRREEWDASRRRRDLP